MSERGALLPTLDRLFSGPRDSVLTIREFLFGLEGRSYAFAVAALDIPNIIPTGIPWLSTVTGVPMLLLAVQYFLGHETPSVPDFVGRRGLPRGRLQDFLARAARWIERLERAIHPRWEFWMAGLPRRALLLVWFLLIVLLALPVPFDNFLPAWSIFFFCLALIEGDGLMAVLGWVGTALTAAWTAFLVVVGPMVVIGLLRSAL
jgi:hypothetical protein